MRTASISTHCFKKSTWISKMSCFPSDKQSLYCPLCTVNELHLVPLYCPSKMSFGEVDSLVEVNVLNCNFFRPRMNSDGQVVSNQQKIVIYNQSQELIFIWTVFHMYVVDEQIHCNLFQHDNSLTRKQSSKEYPADALLWYNSDFMLWIKLYVLGQHSFLNNIYMFIVVDGLIYRFHFLCWVTSYTLPS